MKQHIMNVVLVHGAFADGSGWEAVAKMAAVARFHWALLKPPADF